MNGINKPFFTMAGLAYNYFFSLMNNVGAKAELTAGSFSMRFGEKMLRGHINIQ